MGIPVLILGESGTGKSVSIRRFLPEEVAIFNVASKPLPFREKMENIINGASYSLIAKKISEGKFKKYVIDDSQYLMSFEYFAKVNIKGYEKFTELAVNFCNLIQLVISDTPNDCIVYFLHHTEKTENGVKAKTVGKMLDEKITLEGLFSIVLRTSVSSGEYSFVTQNNGSDTCKSPIDMFDLVIENDLKFVDKTIREYYELGEAENENTERVS